MNLRLKSGTRTAVNKTSLNARNNESAGTTKFCTTAPGNNSGTTRPL